MNWKRRLAVRRVGILCELGCLLFIFIGRPCFTRNINQQKGFNCQLTTLYWRAGTFKWKRSASCQTETRLSSTLSAFLFSSTKFQSFQTWKIMLLDVLFIIIKHSSVRTVYDLFLLYISVKTVRVSSDTKAFLIIRLFSHIHSTKSSRIVIKCSKILLNYKSLRCSSEIGRYAIRHECGFRFSSSSPFLLANFLYKYIY